MPQFKTEEALTAIEEEARRQGVDPAVARAILLSENSGLVNGKITTNPSVSTDTVSSAGALGITQVMPATFQGLVRNGLLSATDDPSDPAVQLKAGVAAIKDGMRVAKTPIEQAVYYNGGPRALIALRNGQALNPETQGYVTKFGAHMGLDTATTTTDNPNPGSSTNTREAFSVHRKNLSPEQIAGIQDSAAAYAGLNADTMAQLKMLASSVLPNADQQNAAVDAQAKAKVEQINAQTGLDQSELSRRQQVVGAFGIDLNDPDNIIARSKVISNSAGNERALLQDQIAALSSKSPMSDPIGWLMDSLKAAPLINRHNALLNVENNAEARIQTAQTEGTAQMNLQPANIKDALNTKNLADVNAALSDAMLKKTQITGVARTQMAQILQTNLSIAGNDLSNKLKSADILASTYSESFSTNDKDKQLPDELKLLNFNLIATGLPPYSNLAFKSVPPETRARLIKWGQNGIKSPGESLALLYDLGGDQAGTMMRTAPMANQFVRSTIAAGMAEYETASKEGVMDPSTRAMVARAGKSPQDTIEFGVGRWSEKMVKELDKKDMTTLSKGNPYRLEPGPVAAHSSMQDNPIAKEIIASKTQRTDEQWVMATMGAKVVNGEISADAAASAIADFYSRGSRIQSAQRGMEVLGFKSPEAYPVTTKLYSGSPRSVELTSRSSIENFLVAETAAFKGSAIIGNNKTAPIGNPMGDYQP